jgi:hypothetical protein
MTSTEFAAKYKLLKCVTERGARTYLAQQLALGRVVMAHFLDDDAAGDAMQVRARLDRLPIGEREKLLEVADVDGVTVVVTLFMPGFENLPAWLDKHTGPPPPRRAAAIQAATTGAPIDVSADAPTQIIDVRSIAAFATPPQAPAVPSAPLPSPSSHTAPPFVPSSAPAPQMPAASAPMAAGGGSFTAVFGALGSSASDAGSAQASTPAPTPSVEATAAPASFTQMFAQLSTPAPQSSPPSPLITQPPTRRTPSSFTAPPVYAPSPVQESPAPPPLNAPIAPSPVAAHGMPSFTGVFGGGSAPPPSNPPPLSGMSAPPPPVMNLGGASTMDGAMGTAPLGSMPQSPPVQLPPPPVARPLYPDAADAPLLGGSAPPPAFGVSSVMRQPFAPAAPPVGMQPPIPSAPPPVMPNVGGPSEFTRVLGRQALSPPPVAPPALNIPVPQAAPPPASAAAADATPGKKSLVPLLIGINIVLVLALLLVLFVVLRK